MEILFDFRFMITFVICTFALHVKAQFISLNDDFEASGSFEWVADDCELNPNYPNPFPNEANPSATVLRYQDYGGLYGNARFTLPFNLNMTTGTTFSMKVYIPSETLTGNAPNQVSVKLQNGFIGSPWTTQTEIIQTVQLDEWQTHTFDFSAGNHLNFDNESPDPIERVDLNRLLIQFNGENNEDLVVAFVDDFTYDGQIGYDPDQSESIFDELIWADEFDGSGALDPSRWYHQTQIPNPWGWFNDEVQHYTDREENSYQEDGLLHIVAKREDFTDQNLQRDFTSARLNSKYAFTYGRVEVRAKLPIGGGTWPAIWTLGKNIAEAGAYWYPQFGTVGWPACGEIDIMEHWGWNQNYVSSALHTPSSFGATENHGGLYAPSVSDGFHVYGMEWDEEEIRFTMDGQIHYIYKPTFQNANTWPFTADQYLILNVAIQNGVEVAFQESEMQIDYVRVYQEEPAPLLIASELKIPFSITQDGAQITIENRLRNPAQLSIYDTQGRLLQSNTKIAVGMQSLVLNYPKQMLLLQFEANGVFWTERLLVE